MKETLNPSAKLYSSGPELVALGAYNQVAQGLYPQPMFDEAIKKARTKFDLAQMNPGSTPIPEGLPETMRASLPDEDLKLAFDSKQKRLEARKLQSKRGLFGAMRCHHADFVEDVFWVDPEDSERRLRIDNKALARWSDHPFAKKVAYLVGMQVSVKTAKSLAFVKKDIDTESTMAVVALNTMRSDLHALTEHSDQPLPEDDQGRTTVYAAGGGASDTEASAVTGLIASQSTNADASPNGNNPYAAFIEDHVNGGWSFLPDRWVIFKRNGDVTMPTHPTVGDSIYTAARQNAKFNDRGQRIDSRDQSDVTSDAMVDGARRQAWLGSFSKPLREDMSSEEALRRQQSKALSSGVEASPEPAAAVPAQAKQKKQEFDYPKRTTRDEILEVLENPLITIKEMIDPFRDLKEEIGPIDLLGNFDVFVGITAYAAGLQVIKAANSVGRLPGRAVHKGIEMVGRGLDRINKFIRRQKTIPTPVPSGEPQPLNKSSAGAD